MDPNATLALLNSAITESRMDEANDHAHTLALWFRTGGFEPDWTKASSETVSYLLDLDLFTPPTFR